MNDANLQSDVKEFVFRTLLALHNDANGCKGWARDEVKLNDGYLKDLLDRRKKASRANANG